MVRQHVDQTTRTRNCKSRNERIETGVSVSTVEKSEKCQRGKKNGKAGGQCSKGDSLVNEHNHPLLLVKRRLRLTEESRSESFWIKRSETV